MDKEEAANKQEKVLSKLSREAGFERLVDADWIVIRKLVCSETLIAEEEDYVERQARQSAARDVQGERRQD